MSAKDNYYSALQRLKRNKPEVLPKDSLINKDTVALEAGRKRGSIREHRGMDDLIAAIAVASGGKTRGTTIVNQKRDKIAAKKRLWEEEKAELIVEIDMLRSRNMSLLYQVYTLTQLLKDNGIETTNINYNVFEFKFDDK
ncbi:hypothetical protein [Serratia fonticola]|uniref:hypothetical protein n=1 Tax=Serratia fonticola TaxID=47917 RepID=UPI00192CF4A1|nr:hypothetical protein [Serratia fonticola]MBL5825693.1 hypothetical protein [Serratia fonticola]